MKILQKGRSMIEMLGVLAIIGVLSIGGLLGYRRAVNNHQANVILDDVNRFAFVILERSGLALGDVVPEGDFVKNSIYQLEGYQDIEPNQFSITVKNVPKGVCEALLPKAVLEYKVGIVTAGGSVNDEVIYDTLNTDLCQDTNDIAFYFGDTSGICNAPDESGYTPCTTNADCCGGEFCVYVNATNADKLGNGNGKCASLSEYEAETIKDSNGKVWTRSASPMNWYSAQNWCEVLGLKPVKRADLGCDNVKIHTCCASSIKTGRKYHWLEDYHTGWAYVMDFSNPSCGWLGGGSFSWSS